jgi:hypothetical protein
VTARQLATSRRDGGPAIALLLAVSTWSAPGGREKDSPAQAGRGRELDGAGSQPGRASSQPGRAAEQSDRAAEQPDQAAEQPDGQRRTATAKETAASAAAHAETGQAAAILSAAGWRVITVDAGMPLATAWQRVAGTDMAPRPVTVSDMPGAAV